MRARTVRGTDTAQVSGADATVYDAATGAPVLRLAPEASGVLGGSLPPGTYYLRVAGQGYLPYPSAGVAPIPFTVAMDEVSRRDVLLVADPNAASLGGLAGRILADSSARAGVLVVALRLSDSSSAATTTAPDGSYVLFNLDTGATVLRFAKAGYAQVGGAPEVEVLAGRMGQAPDASLSAVRGTRLTGKITFLASSNATVDVTLLDPRTRAAVPGLRATTDSAGLAYEIDSIPPGRYLAWASFRNDGYVTDPDRILRAGLPIVEIAATDSGETMDFSVTDAIILVSPTNAADSVRPVPVGSSSPVFRWIKYPSAKEYVIEVVDERGNRIWGGYDRDGAIDHAQITADSARFDFDGTAAIDSLVPGRVYQWRVWADRDLAPGVQELISGSEDQRGLFVVQRP